MSVIAWIVVGLIAGVLGKLIMPGDDPGGIIVTILIGMVGAVIGGFVVGLLGGTGATGFNIWSILVATLGAIILLAIYRAIAGGAGGRKGALPGHGGPVRGRAWRRTRARRGPKSGASGAPGGPFTRRWSPTC